MKGDIRDRVAREKTAHESDNVLAESYRIKDKFPHVYTYPSRLRIDEYITNTIRELDDPFILDYGCGYGDAALDYYKLGSRVTGIDIAEPYIEFANSRILENNISEDKLSFLVMDAHSLDFPVNTFDLVIGKGILHHLEWQNALNEIHRVLKPGGRVLLTEPLVGSPLMRLFRKATPAARTVDEAPFSHSDIKIIESTTNWKCESLYCGIISLPIALLTSKIFPNNQENFLTKIGDNLEKYINRRNILESWNQYILFNLVKNDTAGNC